jgi:GPH family glycoside/pentoside/hexuronide:cation symporter
MYQLIFAMVADVCEYDTLVNGKERAGTFAAVLSWSIKFGIMAALFMSGFVLNITGFDAKLPTQLPETIVRMRLIYATIPAAGFVISAVMIMLFPVSAAKLEELRKKYGRDAK